MVILAVAVGSLIALFACGGGGGSFQADVVLVLAPADDQGDLGAALDQTIDIIERRAEDILSAEVKVDVEGDQLIVELRGTTAEEAQDVIAQQGLLQFCEPVTNESGDVATVLGGDVEYQNGTCDPFDEDGTITTDSGDVRYVPWVAFDLPQSVNNPRPQDMVWQSATADIDGQLVVLDGMALDPSTEVFEDAIGLPHLMFAWVAEAQDAADEVTTRLAQRTYPMSVFLAGKPLLGEDGAIVAPSVQAPLRDGGTISGLSRADAEQLSRLLDIGPLPVPLDVVDVRELSSWTGDGLPTP